MSKDTKIEWCHHTVNLWWGCAKVSPACAHCYAESLANRTRPQQVTWGAGGKRWIRTAAAVAELLALDESARKRGVRERVFVNSMSDTFEDRRDLDEARRALFTVATRLTNLDLLLLTKRPENVLPWLREHTGHEPSFTTADDVAREWLAGQPPANVWLGVTVEDQARAEERIPALLAIPAAVRFLSCEPLLGPVDLDEVPMTDRCYGVLGNAPGMAAGIDWVIAGGESGHGARPMHPDWVRSLRDQCQAAGVAFFHKQWGEWIARSQLLQCRRMTAMALMKDVHGKVMRRDGGIDESLGDAHSSNDDDSAIHRVGKKAAGRLLDGVLHDAFPQATDGHRPPLQGEEDAHAGV